jgi:RimJ/RimL family protein N-acetyltransferase
MSLKLTLRPIDKSDAATLMTLRNGEDTYRWFFSEKQFTLEEVESWIVNLNPSNDLVFMVEREQVVVGTCSIYNIEANTAEVGRIIIAEPLRGKGMGTAVLRAIDKVAIDKQLTKLYANIKVGNIRSTSAFERSGYTLIEERPITGYYYEKVVGKNEICCHCLINMTEWNDKQSRPYSQCRHCREDFSRSWKTHHNKWAQTRRELAKDRRQNGECRQCGNPLDQYRSDWKRKVTSCTECRRKERERYKRHHGPETAV